MSEDLVTQELSIVKMDDFNGYDEALVYAQKLIDTKLISFAKAEHAVMAFNMGKAIGLAPSIAATNLFVVNGRITFSVHLAAALAKKAGIEWEILEDAVEIRDEKGNQIPPYLRTTIKFYRYNPEMKRTFENVFTYNWGDACTAGYDKKDNWKRMPKNMLRARCLIEGIRFVAPDALAGVFYESTEITDNSKEKFDFDIDESGNPIMVTNKR